MEAIELLKETLYTRGGVLDELMDKIFDVSILVDRECHILHMSCSAYATMNQSENLDGQPVSIVDNVSPFAQVIREGKPATGLLLEICGRKCVSSLFPIVDEGEVIGVLGTILFRSLSVVKEIFAQLPTAENTQVGEIYQRIAQVDSGYTFTDYLGESPVVKELLVQARRAAAYRYPVLIIGETGTGKEIISGAIHNARHPNYMAPYVTLNCTAIPENLLESELFGHEKGAFTGADQAKAGKFELAERGDILLDEIGDMSPNLQGKLLRVLESREFERVGGRRVIPFHAGVVAATNKNLPRLSRNGQFRADLYYRLSVIELFLPPLRHRTEDIPLLLEHFGRGLRLAPSAQEMLCRYPWPGNVRELKNLLRRLAVLWGEGQITGEQVRSTLAGGEESYNQTLGEVCVQTPEPAPYCSLEEAEREAVSAALEAQKQNVAGAARLLGVSRTTLYQKMKKYGL